MGFRAGGFTVALRIGALLLAGGLGLAGCGGAGDSPDSGGEGSGAILATTDIWRDVVANLACDGLAEVSALIPPGADPHSFEPSLRDRAALGDAALVVVNGLDLEEGLEDTIDTVRDDGVAVVAVSDHIDPPPLGGDTGGDDGHAAGDPHIWFDPLRVRSALPALAAALVDEAGLDADAVRACLDDYRAELEEVHADVARTLASVPEPARRLVTNHDALPYLADRYGYEVIGTVIPSNSSLAQTNAAQLQRLVATVRSNDVGAIFAESQASSDDAEALGREAGGVQVVTLFTGALGDEGSGADTYAGFMRTNATLIAEGLGASM